MTQLATRAALNAMLAIGVLVLLPTAAGLLRPETAAADPPRTGGQKAIRSHVFHYPALKSQPGQKKKRLVQRVLEAHQDTPTVVKVGKMRDSRMIFADDVVAEVFQLTSGGEETSRRPYRDHEGAGALDRFPRLRDGRALRSPSRCRSHDGGGRASRPDRLGQGLESGWKLAAANSGESDGRRRGESGSAPSFGEWWRLTANLMA
jgi:hypothetical protein